MRASPLARFGLLMPVASLSGGLFAAGSDTSASAIAVSVMAAACFPEKQRLVQEELDRVVGRDRCAFFRT